MREERQREWAEVAEWWKSWLQRDGVTAGC